MQTDNNQYIWFCPTCNKSGKSPVHYNKAFKLFTSHRYSRQSKLFWDCEFDAKKVEANA